jgi:hypothetical protein
MLVATRTEVQEPSSYVRAVRALEESGIPFLAGGALALRHYTGIQRTTKDLDLFVREADVQHALDALRCAGLHTELPYPHWLGKAHGDDDLFVDVIFNAGNGLAPVDDEWFAHARPAELFGMRVLLCPPEETIWTKAFVMERERYDGADVAHLLLACAGSLDWTRLIRRFGDHWRVLLSHLTLFGFIYPDEADRVPAWVMDDLVERLRTEPPNAGVAGRHMCRGTLLSREQYIVDLERGWCDARLPPTGTMSPDAIAIWTEARAKHEGDRSLERPSSSPNATTVK